VARRPAILKWAPETWAAVVGSLVAVFALALALYEGHQSRQHDKLSVQPDVTITFQYNEVDDADKKGAGWEMVNHGFGPARVKWFSVQVDGKPVEDWYAAASALGFRTLEALTHANPTEGAVYPVGGERIRLFWLSADAEAQELRRVSGVVRMSLCYCSFYGDCWQANSESRGSTEGCSGTPRVIFKSPPTWLPPTAEEKSPPSTP
jgi:hypothetical protein